MRNINRIDEFCADFAAIWKKVPDWRFMQLICNFTRWLGQDGFYMEEDMVLEKLNEFFNER